MGADADRIFVLLKNFLELFFHTDPPVTRVHRGDRTRGLPEDISSDTMLTFEKQISKKSKKV